MTRMCNPFFVFMVQLHSLEMMLTGGRDDDINQYSAQKSRLHTMPDIVDCVVTIVMTSDN